MSHAPAAGEEGVDANSRTKFSPGFSPAQVFKEGGEEQGMKRNRRKKSWLSQQFYCNDNQLFLSLMHCWKNDDAKKLNFVNFVAIHCTKMYQQMSEDFNNEHPCHATVIEDCCLLM